MTEARLIGPASELGDVSEGLEFYGNTITRDWGEVDLTAEQIEKAKGNRYIELKGAPDKPEDATEAKQEADKEAARAAEKNEEKRLQAAEKAAAKGDDGQTAIDKARDEPQPNKSR